MILELDYLIFGNGYGMAAPRHDNVFYWLSGELYTFSYGFGAQLKSFQWTHPKPGERRTLAGREFVVFNSYRRWVRVNVSWAMTRMPSNIDGMNAAIRKLQADLQSI